MRIIEAFSINKVYSNGDIDVQALDGVSFNIDKGEYIAIAGASGSGKSTLLSIIGGLEYPSGGFISVNGQSLSAMENEELTIFRRRNIGFVFQNYNLVPRLNVFENIVLPIKLDERSVDIEFVEELVKSLEIGDKLYQMPNELSGGQQQRVAIARALITQPAIVLADEPTGNLDSKNSNKVISLMKEMARKYQQTMAIVTHDEKIARMADRIIEMEDGRIISNGVAYE